MGGGFGGFEVAKRLARAPVSVTIVDQRNHHVFQPLLYQVATACLATSEVAWPIRGLFRTRPDVATVLGTVVAVDPKACRVDLDDHQSIPYDTLVLATGARHAYFGHDDWKDVAPGLKTLEDAVRIRGNVLLAFERAEWEPDAAEQAALMTFVVVGAGATGVELAGTIAELAKDTLRRDFRHIDTARARVILVEAGQRVLAGFPENLSAYAQRTLAALGVEVQLGRAVSNCSAEGVVIGDEPLAARTIIWAAGVRASEAAKWVNAPTDRAGRIKVRPDLTVPNHPEIFAIGDTMTVDASDGIPVPGIAPAAKQAGQHVARTIEARLTGDQSSRPFKYKHLGNLAQIGKRRAVIDLGWTTFRGPIAWWLWGLAHIYFLIGVRTRLSVALNWLWVHTRNQRSARLITQRSPSDKSGDRLR